MQVVVIAPGVPWAEENVVSAPGGAKKRNEEVYANMARAANRMSFGHGKPIS